MEKLTLIVGQGIKEFENLRALLDWTIFQMKEETKARVDNTTIEGALSSPKGEEEDLSQYIQDVKEGKHESKSESPKAEKPPNSFDLPAMKRPFFGGKGKENLLSFNYLINGETPRKRPADTARILFTKTKAFLSMPRFEQEKVINWGLSFLKKQVRESQKPAAITTTMATPFEIDRFRFMGGQTVEFKVSIKKE